MCRATGPRLVLTLIAWKTVLLQGVDHRAREGHPTPTQSTDLERRQFRSPFHSISNPVHNQLEYIVYK